MNAKKHLLPVGRPQNDRRLEVQIEHDEAGRRRVVLQDLSWGPGVGWYVQKTLRLDPAHVEALLGALCCARQQSEADTAATASSCRALPPTPARSEVASAQVIPLERFRPQD